MNTIKKMKADPEYMEAYIRAGIENHDEDLISMLVRIFHLYIKDKDGGETDIWNNYKKVGKDD